jgi:hypothetical protein
LDHLVLKGNEGILIENPELAEELNNGVFYQKSSIPWIIIFASNKEKRIFYMKIDREPVYCRLLEGHEQVVDEKGNGLYTCEKKCKVLLKNAIVYAVPTAITKYENDIVPETKYDMTFSTFHSKKTFTIKGKTVQKS